MGAYGTITIKRMFFRGFEDLVVFAVVFVVVQYACLPFFFFTFFSKLLFILFFKLQTDKGIP